VLGRLRLAAGLGVPIMACAVGAARSDGSLSLKVTHVAA
jgi:hypothetical protein